MFSKTDFWIGLAVGAVAGIFGYRFMQERTQQLAALEAGQADLSLAELQRQKEELEDLIAAQSASEQLEFHRSRGCRAFARSLFF